MLRTAVSLLVILLGASGPAYAGNGDASVSIGPAIRVDGPAEIVFDSTADGCGAWDISDTPARAWRDGDGRVHLLSGSERSRAGLGPDLGSVEHNCAVLFEGGGNDDPGAYDDRAWIHATYALEDGSVLALAHVEFHGHRRPDLCPAQDYAACWRNAVVELRSDDGGRTFRRAPGAGVDLVAALPYRFDGGAGHRTGYFNPSNIVRRGGYLYTFVFAEAYGAQARGACLLRRTVDGDAGGWRAWDGSGFNVRFADPYAEEVANPGAHVCAPLDGVQSTLSSLIFSPAAGHWRAVTAATRPDAQGVPRTGIWTTASTDLLHWSEPELLLEVPLLWRRDCSAPAAYAYPALLDDNSASPNFETADGRLWLYLVEMPLGPAGAKDACRVGSDRRLVRFPVRWRAAD